ncbi:MAG: efflux RND transporter periplasmic adaptor subunit [Bacteroidetes bacterium]|jgi:multidrug efflux pump subunit AcrA (membrane-fusion protein)|nr:efflux RND transporter periplasmic adaptor subunit [Bacteroidota bacterium]MBL0016214.1 efflux RND transporter periplasmic adaptor subunit [Bacteroidota bacterium]MBP6640323.1 efflux RND transporter periplasmic adaptor subunit [Bacteroidia bacterium]MBP6720886.1 efflux RND transporter periplasmic adaptor subunit [Bacteroidia bacterium]MBP8073497.1 efflux RND transporter periplasmic adaptor subunit [Bacteroidia bacterium]
MAKENWLRLKMTALALVAGLILFSGCSKKAAEDVLQKPTEGDFEVIVTTTGELQAKNSVDISGPTGARKAGIYQLKITQLVAEGTVVAPGDFVAELDKSEIVGKLKEVEINLQKFQSVVTQAKLDCTLTLAQTRDELINLRYAKEQRKLEKDESAYESPSAKRQAEIEFEKAVRSYDQSQNNYQTKVKQAEAKMREAEADLNKEAQKLTDYQSILGEFTIMAPEQGMLIYAREWDGKKRVVGSTVSPWDPTVATLPDLTRMESITYVNEVDIQKIKVGQEVRVSLDASPDKKLTGKVTQVANVGEQRPNSDSKVFEVKIQINESDSTLRPAMTTSNEIIISTFPKVRYIPLECVHVAQDSIPVVFKRSSGKIVRQEVKLGAENENSVIVEKGVDANEELYLSKPEGGDELELIRLGK